MVILLNNLVREKTNPAFKECVKKPINNKKCKEETERN